MEGDYRRLSCCNGTRNIDEVLSKYIVERDNIIKLSVNNPVELTSKIWSIDGYLSNDPKCMCNAGKLKKFTHYKCPPCVNMGRLIDYDDEKLNKPFFIECGDMVGNMFIFISHPVGKLNTTIEEQDKKSAQKFLSDHINMLTCGTQEVEGLTFVRSDIFTNNILVWWTVDKIYEQKSLPFGLNLHTAYICRDEGFMLSNAPTLGSYKKLKNRAIEMKWDRYKTCSSICKQLGIMLDVLHDNFFSHGNPHLDVLLFSEQETDIDYNDISLSSDFLMHIVDFTYSSITNGNTRLYPKTERSDILINCQTLHIDIKDGRYYISNKSDILFNYIRHAGLPIYSSSFDFYCFIVSLMLDKYFYDSVKGDPFLNKAWESIWLESDLEIIENRIKKNMNKNIDIVRLLSKLWLECNVVKLWLSNL